MRVAVRADASLEIGTGHVMRCLVLAESLQAHGARVVFICRQLAGNMIDAIAEKGFEVVDFPPGDANPDAENGYLRMLGVAGDKDAEDTASALKGGSVWDWLIVDHYALDTRWEIVQRPFVKQIAVIDDLANRDHDCDVLIDQNYSLHPSERYRARVPEGCKCFLGPRFSLMRPEYRHERAKLSPRSGVIRRVLLFFGGVDASGLTLKALQALDHPAFRQWHIDVVAGTRNPALDEIKHAARRMPNATMHVDLPHLAELMALADLAIGAGGVTTWERCCLGLPTLVVTVAENQEPAVRALASEGVVKWLGRHDVVSVLVIREALHAMAGDPDSLRSMSLNAMKLADGSGSDRVARWMSGDIALDGLSLRRARRSDMWLYFHWANEPTVRANALNPASIDPETHRKWFADRLNDAESMLYVLETGSGAPLGQLRFDSTARDGFRVSYSIDQRYRGRGLACDMVKMGIHQVLGEVGRASTFRAEVLPHNQASRRVLQQCGFELQPPAGDGCHENWLRKPE